MSLRDSARIASAGGNPQATYHAVSGGWIVGSNVVSVNSYGYGNQPNVMYGPYQGSTADGSRRVPVVFDAFAGMT